MIRYLKCYQQHRNMIILLCYLNIAWKYGIYSTDPMNVFNAIMNDNLIPMFTYMQLQSWYFESFVIQPTKMQKYSVLDLNEPNYIFVFIMCIDEC